MPSYCVSNIPRGSFTNYVNAILEFFTPPTPLWTEREHFEYPPLKTTWTFEVPPPPLAWYFLPFFPKIPQFAFKFFYLATFQPLISRNWNQKYMIWVRKSWNFRGLHANKSSHPSLKKLRELLQIPPSPPMWTNMNIYETPPYPLAVHVVCEWPLT